MVCQRQLGYEKVAFLDQYLALRYSITGGVSSVVIQFLPSSDTNKVDVC